uniref:Uncharacterized protein n=1 Tax=Leersia perrieri TaxID=77586 RepID=A0A0D9WK29_9ORYZ
MGSCCPDRPDFRFGCGFTVPMACFHPYCQPRVCCYPVRPGFPLLKFLDPQRPPVGVRPRQARPGSLLQWDHLRQRLTCHGVAAEAYRTLLQEDSVRPLAKPISATVMVASGLSVTAFWVGRYYWLPDTRICFVRIQNQFSDLYAKMGLIGRACQPN